jgi:hypothetical protein
MPWHKTVRGLYKSVRKKDDTCVCLCLKPKLLNMTCSHVLAACVECGTPPEIYVLDYFRKKSIACTWKYELHWYCMIRSFNKQASQVFYIRDLRMKYVKRGHRKARCIRNDTDESKA